MVGVNGVNIGVDEHAKWKTTGVIGDNGASDVAPPALLLVGVRVSMGCMAGDDEDESLLNLDGREHSLMCGVVDMNGAAARAVGKEGHAAPALVGAAGIDGVRGCGENLFVRHAFPGGPRW